jgi:hypothetical protein
LLDDVGMKPSELLELKRRQARAWRDKADRLACEPKSDEAFRQLITGRTRDVQIAELRRAADIADPTS